jgi:hypothetical protein
MTDHTPTPQEARAALAEANSQSARVRRADHQFRWILLLLVAIYLVAAAIVSATSRPGPSFGWLVGLLLVGGGLVGIGLLVWWIRAYSKAGIRWFTGAAAAFTWWNAIVCGVSILTGWWGPHQPNYHFGVSALVAVIPLIVAAWLVGRR